MEIKTRIFHRVVEEARLAEQEKAVKAVADTMEEGVRFESFSRSEKEELALKRINGAF